MYSYIRLLQNNAVDVNAAAANNRPESLDGRDQEIVDPPNNRRRRGDDRLEEGENGENRANGPRHRNDRQQAQVFLRIYD